MSLAPFTDFSCQLEKIAGAMGFEIAAFRIPSDSDVAPRDVNATPRVFDAWPLAPGAALREASGRLALLHIAPTRWFAPDPSAETLSTINTIAAAGMGVVVDVSGKWQAMTLRGSGASRVLASSVDIEAILSGRECAALTLFDCPAIAARLADGFAIWVLASYAVHFVTAVERLSGIRPGVASG